MPEVGIHRKGEVDHSTLFEKLKTELKGKAGAMASFVGIVRETSKTGEPVKYLHYECSEEAGEKLKEIALDAERKEGILRVLIHHVIDDLKPGEDAIHVIVAGKHRGEVFETLSRVMDRVKAEVPIWKKEITETREYWIHETE